MSIARFQRDADHLLQHFDLRRSGGRFEMQVDHVYSGDPVARSWHWTQDGGEAAERACAQMMVALRVVAGRDWHVLDFADPELWHRRPQAGAAALGRARGEWHVFAFQGASEAAVVDGSYMLFEAAEDFAAARDELLRHDG
jgi:hypothetical protein